MEESENRITQMSDDYLEVFKPLLAKVEDETDTIHEVLFDQARNYLDHIARIKDEEDRDINQTKELDKAEGHLNRMCLDCLKILCINLHEKNSEYDGYLKYNIEHIDNGKFYKKLCELQSDAILNYQKARLAERYDKEDSLDYYQKSYIYYKKLNKHYKKYKNDLTMCKWQSIIIIYILPSIFGLTLSVILFIVS